MQTTKKNADFLDELCQDVEMFIEYFGERNSVALTWVDAWVDEGD